MLGNELETHMGSNSAPIVYPSSDQYMIYFHPDFMAQEIMTGVPGYTKVSKFTLLALEDLGYFIADLSKADYYNFLRADLVAKTVGTTKPMNIPITPNGDGELATVNAECL